MDRKGSSVEILRILSVIGKRDFYRDCCPAELALADGQLPTE
jgi:hypothetical protein